MTVFLNALSEFFTFSHIMVFVYILNTIISLGLIFLDNRKSPSAILAWIMVLYLLPIIGLLTYIVLSQNIARQQIFRMTSNEDNDIKALIGWQKEYVRKGISSNPEDETHRWRDMITLNLDYAD